MHAVKHMYIEIPRTDLTEAAWAQPDLTVINMSYHVAFEWSDFAK